MSGRDLIAEVDALMKKYGHLLEEETEFGTEVEEEGMMGGARGRVAKMPARYRDNYWMEFKNPKKPKLKPTRPSVINRTIGDAISSYIFTPPEDRWINATFGIVDISKEDVLKMTPEAWITSGLRTVIETQIGTSAFQKYMTLKCEVRDWFDTASATSQCEAIIPSADVCWLCGTAFGDAGTTTNNLVRACDHVLPISLAIVFTGIWRKKHTTAEQAGRMANQYKWAHQKCNIYKSDKSFLRIQDETHVEADTANIHGVLTNIYHRALENTAPNTWGSVVGTLDVASRQTSVVDTLTPLFRQINTNVPGTGIRAYFTSAAIGIAAYLNHHFKQFTLIPVQQTGGGLEEEPEDIHKITRDLVFDLIYQDGTIEADMKLFVYRGDLLFRMMEDYRKTYPTGVIPNPEEVRAKFTQEYTSHKDTTTMPPTIQQDPLMIPLPNTPSTSMSDTSPKTPPRIVPPPTMTDSPQPHMIPLPITPPRMTNRNINRKTQRSPSASISSQKTLRNKRFRGDEENEHHDEENESQVGIPTV